MRRTVATSISGPGGAVLYGDVGFNTPEFVVRSLVRFLEASPPAHVIYKNRAEVRLSTFDYAEEVLQRVSPLNSHATYPRVDEGAHDGDAVRVRETLDWGVLVLGGILLVVRRHAYVFCGLDDTARVVSGMTTEAKLRVE